VRTGGWGSTTVELPGPVTDALTGASYAGRTAVTELLSRYPVALLLPD
jgi:maltooligosyltrehalose synthase